MAFLETLDLMREAARIPGLSVAVLVDGKVVIAAGLGYADLERHVPATPNTPYNIASVAKPISAVLSLKLAEEGLLDLDRPMTTFAGFREFCADFRNQQSIFARDLRCHSEPLTLRHVLSHAVNGPVGQKFSYNPIMFSWASRPMSEVADIPFSNLVQQYVFEPAGMKRSARFHRDLPLRKDLAAELAPPYDVDDDSGLLIRASEPAAQGDGAAGGVISTVLDLAEFDIALDSGKLISPASREAMMSPALSPSGLPLPYGLGVFVQNYRGNKLVWHSGWWPNAYSALYLKVPEKKLTLILLANSDGLWWGNPLDAAEVERSAFAQVFFRYFLQ